MTATAMLVVLGNFGPWEFQTGTVVKGWRTNGNVFGVSTQLTGTSIKGWRTKRNVFGVSTQETGTVVKG